MMIQYPVRILAAVVCILACSGVLVPYATASDPCRDWEYPSAYFSYEVLQRETLPVAVQFTDASRSPASDQQINRRNWDFSDGSASTEKNPSHSFSTYKDHFDVCLRATTVCGGHDTECKQVEAYCTEPRAGFIINVTEGPAPLHVRVTDTSEHTPGSVTTWTYRKNGDTFETDRNFEGYFTTPGIYTITQTVKKNCNPNSDSYSREIRVKEAIVMYTIMNLSVPTTTPSLGFVGVFFGNMSVITTTPTTTTPTTTTTATATTKTTTRAVTAMTTTVAPVTVLSTAGTGTATTSVTTASPGFGIPVVTGTGTLSLVTTPSGAQIYIDDILRGASPATIPDIPAGTHTLRLERNGYQAITVPVDIAEGEITSYSTALVPESGGIGMLPLIIGVIVILALVGAGAYLYMQKKKIP